MSDPTGDEALTPRRARRPATRFVQCLRCGATGTTDDTATFPTVDGQVRHVTSRVVGDEGTYRRQSTPCGPARSVA